MTFATSRTLNDLLKHIAEIAIAAGDAPAGYRLEADYRERRKGDVRDSLAAIDAARALLGYDPKVRVREGLERTYQAFRTFTPRA